MLFFLIFWPSQIRRETLRSNGKDFFSFFSFLENRDQGENCVEHGAGVGDEQLLLVQVQGRDEQLRSGGRAPDHNEAGAQGSEDALQVMVKEGFIKLYKKAFYVDAPMGGKVKFRTKLVNKNEIFNSLIRTYPNL
jgi:hypothetical protein